MKKYLEHLKRSLYVLLTIAAAAALWTACDEAIVIGEADATPLETALELQGFLRDAGTSRTAIPVEIRGDAEVQVYLGLTRATDAAATARVAVDAALVDAYNRENNTAYPAFPAAQATVSNGGAASVAKWRTASDPIAISLSKGALEEQTYLLPVTVSNESVTIPETAKTLYYFVKVAGSIPDISKGDVKTLVYIEVNEGNPLNAGNYLLQDSRKPFFDYVVIFAANVQYNREANEVYLKYNDNVAHLLNNRDKYIKPLQDKGIKVLLGLLPDHAGVGLANLKGQALLDFAAKTKTAVDFYGLDGVDFDDEWSDYGKNNTDIFYAPEWNESGTKMARLIIETRRIMPDKIITVFEFNRGTSVGGTVDGVTMIDIIDYSMYASYPGSNSGTSTRTSSIGLPKSRYSPAAVNLRQNDAAPMTGSMLGQWATVIKNNGYGFLFFYDLRTEDQISRLSAASNVLYGEPVVMERDAYPKDW